MNLLSLVALCLISSRPALSLNSERTPKAGFLVRDDPSQTVSLTQPSPTSTNPDVVSAYNTYSQKCGTDLNTATQEALETYENVSSQKDVSITDSAFLSWASVNFPDYMQASQACQTAQLDYQDAVAKAGSGSSSQPASAPPSSAAGPSSATPSSTAPPQPSSSAPGASAPPKSSASSSSPAQPSQSKPASAAFHGPSWALALGGLAAILYIS